MGQDNRMNFITQKTKLIDCDDSGSPDGLLRELIIVEGDSASRSVARIRDRRFQAVLPMQGKPMNATKSSLKSIQKNQWFTALVDALGIGWNERPMEQLRYQRIFFLFDPDADGIHCGALMLLFFDTYFPNLLESHRVAQIKPPQFQIRAVGYRDTLQAYSPEHLAEFRRALDQKTIPHSYQRYRGLASLDDGVLQRTCIDPKSRTVYLLRRRDAEDVKRIFARRAAD